MTLALQEECCSDGPRVEALVFPERWDDPSVLSVQGAVDGIYDRFSQGPPDMFVNKPRMMALKRLARKIATGTAKPGPENLGDWMESNRNLRQRSAYAIPLHDTRAKSENDL